MKLLSKVESDQRLKKEHDELIGKNTQLLNYFTKGIKRLNDLKDNYDPEKAKKTREFENFCRDIDLKKSKKLEELAAVEKHIEERKEVYYGLVAKQDELIEREFLIKQKEDNLVLREGFTKEGEAKLKHKFEELLKI